jgi:predicted transcriptional regulator
MKTNITLKVDRELLRRARVLAAEKDTSVSALVSEQLEKVVREREGYEQAKQHALAVMKRGFNLGYKRPSSRDELHER